MRRLVYSPYVRAYVKSDEGVVDISPYLVSGSVNRKVNQVSSAQLTLRNPVQGDTSKLLFTEHTRKDGSIGPLFHPMDPIIIIMQRLQGHPVQVFTGYLDKSPYLQFYPGLCTIEASCTLKRLLYTQWDAALPFVVTFLSQYGWVLQGDSGISNPTSDSQKLATEAGQLLGQFNDGSLGALLYAILVHVGNWDPSIIWIEALPANIRDFVTNLYQQISTEVGQSEGFFQSLIGDILGASALGTGSSTGTPSGPVHNAKQIVQTVQPIAASNGVPLRMVLAVMFIETGFSNTDTPGNPHYGWFQCQLGGCYAYGPFSKGGYTIADTHDLGLASTAFCAAAAGYAKADPSLKQDIHKWAETTQGVLQSIQGGGNQYYVSGWADALATADSYISKYSNAGGSGAAALSTAPTSSPFSPSANPFGSTNAQKSGASPGGKKGAPGASAGDYLATIIPNGTKIVVERTDMGVDFSIPDGTALGAIGSGTVAITTTNFYQGQPLMMVTLDTPINGYKGFYISEGIRPTKTSGRVSAGEQIALAENHGTGIEMGWGDPSTGNPVADTYYKEGQQTPDGVAFANAVGVPALSTGQNQSATVSGTPIAGSGGGAATAGGATQSNATAAAFASLINLPSVFQQAEALAFTGKRSFIADQPLFPFIEQLCQASLRNFMSMPNGNFFAFFPDYFGLFGRKYYWEIRDIEIMDGRIDLSDDPLVTHVAVAGDVTQWHGTVDVFDLLLTSGIFTVFDAMATGYVGNVADSTAGKIEGGVIHAGKPTRHKASQSTGKKSSSRQAALTFLQTYGARPYVEEAPMIRSPIFELFLAFQRFMLLWSKQFQTTFELTFMPELFPGGIVAFPDHHIQCYIEEVIHEFDYSEGFTTTINISSPSQLPNDKSSRPNVSEGMARKALLTG